MDLYHPSPYLIMALGIILGGLAVMFLPFLHHLFANRETLIARDLRQARDALSRLYDLAPSDFTRDQIIRTIDELSLVERILAPAPKKES